MNARKEMFNAKLRYAERKNSENFDIAVMNGMEEEQASAIVKLCTYRHYIHTHQDSLWCSESADYDEMNDLLNGGIYKMLKEVGIKNMLVWATSDLDNDQTYDLDLDDATEEEKEEAYEEAYQAVYDFVERVNKQIEKFLKEIDKKYDTKFCPTGSSRLF